MPSRNAANQDTVTGGNWQNPYILTAPELESNDFCYSEKKFPATMCCRLHRAQLAFTDDAVGPWNLKSFQQQPTNLFSCAPEFLDAYL